MHTKRAPSSFLLIPHVNQNSQTILKIKSLDAISPQISTHLFGAELAFNKAMQTWPWPHTAEANYRL